MIHVAASSRMLALALRIDEREFRQLSEEEVEGLLVGELYRRFPKYSPDVDGNGELMFTIIRQRRYELVFGGISLAHTLKTVYTEDYETMSFRDHSLLMLMAKKAA
jgi:hypothetical protein